MSRIVVTALWLICFHLAGCRSEPKDFSVIMWDGGSRLEDLTWKMNDKPCGQGLDGFRNVLSHIRGLKMNAYIRVRYPMEKWNEIVVGYREDDPFPFRDHDDLRKEFCRLCIEKKLTLEREGFSSK